MFDFIKFIVGLLGLILFIPLFIVLIVLCSIYLIFLIPVYFMQVILESKDKDSSSKVETNLNEES
jgi:hypothetical protein